MAGKIEPYNTYALLNVARLELLISKTEPSRLPIAIKQFHDIKALCQFNVTQDPADSWRRFDLADTYLFSGDHARAKELYLDAIKTIKNERRRSYLTAVVAPLHELLNIGALSGDLKSSVEDVAKVIDGQIRT